MTILRLKPIEIYEIRMTPENLARHMEFDPQNVLTGRSSQKGIVGDLFFIRGAGIYQLMSVKRYKDVAEYTSIQENVIREGFTNGKELFDILAKVYGAHNKIVAHELHKMYGLEAEEIIEQC